MTPTGVDVVQFVPSRVEGVDDVREVAFHCDHVAVLVGDVWRRFDYARIGRVQAPRRAVALRRLLRMHPIHPIVGERDWFKAPSERSFTLFTEPPLRICMPLDDSTDHENSAFGRVWSLIRAGGFDTWDSG